MTDKVPNTFEFEEESSGILAFRHKKNGLQVLVLSDSSAPVATVMITYRVGSRHERTGLTGATHFLEHLMFKGTERFHKRKGTSVFNVLQSVGARVNATTWLDRTNYFELLPKEHLDLALEVEADRMRHALIDPEDLESERTVILNEFDRGENEPIRKLYHAVWSTAYIAHPYHHPTIGWRSDIETLTREGLRHFYDSFYWPNNATLSLIGDLTVQEALLATEKHFGHIARAAMNEAPSTTREPEQRGERRVTIKKAGQVGSIIIAYKSPRATDSDTDALDVLSMILSYGKNSRLYRRLTDRGLTSQASASTSRLYDPGLFSIFALLIPGSTHEEVENAIYAVLSQVAEEGVTQSELQRAKNQLKAQEAFGRDGSYAVAAQLNEAIAAGDWKLFTTLNERMESISEADVQRVARVYCVEDQRTVGWFVPS